MVIKSMALPDEVIFAEPQMRPIVRISPFLPESLEKNSAIALTSGEGAMELKSLQPCQHRNMVLTRSGRTAIRLALNAIKLNSGDEVLVVTTGMSRYISRCVTEEIERVCRWSQSVGPRTRCIFVIHSFGFEASIPPEAVSLEVPIIEDCAYGFGSAGCGSLGDFVIYSFSKAFPIPFGGALLSRESVGPDPNLSDVGKEYLLRVMPYYLSSRQAAFDRRRAVFSELASAFGEMSLFPHYEPDSKEVPHAFVFNFPDELHAARLRIRMDEAGIESSVYYGSGGYYVPCHQNMGTAHVEYVVRRFQAAITKEAATQEALEPGF